MSKQQIKNTVLWQQNIHTSRRKTGDTFVQRSDPYIHIYIYMCPAIFSFATEMWLHLIPLAMETAVRCLSIFAPCIPEGILERWYTQHWVGLRPVTSSRAILINTTHLRRSCRLPRPTPTMTAPLLSPQSISGPCPLMGTLMRWHT